MRLSHFASLLSRLAVDAFFVGLDDDYELKLLCVGCVTSSEVFIFHISCEASTTCWSIAEQATRMNEREKFGQSFDDDN